MSLDDIPQSPTLDVKPTQESLQSWIDRPFISENVREQLSTANVLIVPNEDYSEHEDVLFFPEGTEALFLFLRDNQRDDVLIDICIEDKDYKELARHADLVVIPGIIATLIVAPVVADLIADFIKRRLGSREHDATVKFNLTVEDEQLGRSMSLSYEGPATEYRNYMLSALQKLREPQNVLLPKPQKVRRSSSSRRKRRKKK